MWMGFSKSSFPATQENSLCNNSSKCKEFIKNGPRNSMHFKYSAMLLEQRTTNPSHKETKNGDSEWKSASNLMLSDVCMGPAHVAWNGNRTSSHLQGPDYKHTYSSARNSKDMRLEAVNSRAQTAHLPLRSQVYHPEQFTCSLGQFDLK